MGREIEFNKEIEVSREQYQKATDWLGGIVATRTTGWLWWKRYYLKLWSMKYKHHLEMLLASK